MNIPHHQFCLCINDGYFITTLIGHIYFFAERIRCESYMPLIIGSTLHNPALNGYYFTSGKSRTVIRHMRHERRSKIRKGVHIIHAKTIVRAIGNNAGTISSSLKGSIPASQRKTCGSGFALFIMTATGSAFGQKNLSDICRKTTAGNIYYWLIYPTAMEQGQDDCRKSGKI